MKPTLLALTLLATATAAQAESTRLAYSKAEDVEVFVDHPAAAWCAPTMTNVGLSGTRIAALLSLPGRRRR